MHDNDAVNLKFLSHLRADFAHFRERHCFIGFIFEIQRPPTAEIVAYKAVEHYDSAVLRCLEGFNQLQWPDRLADKLKNILDRRDMLSAAHRRKKRHLIARGKRLAPTGVLLIHRSRNRRSKFSQLRKAPAVTLEKILHARAVGKLSLVLLETYNVL